MGVQVCRLRDDDRTRSRAGFTRALILGFCCLCLLSVGSVSARALDPNLNVSQFTHAAWLTQDGYFSGQPSVVTQTRDGYLWIGTRSGLMRFDGSRFLPWTSPDAKRLPSNVIVSLLGAQDGSLWIGTRAGLAHFVNGKLVQFPNFPDTIDWLFEDPAGKIWFTRDNVQRSPPVCEVSGAAIHCLDKTDGVSLMGAAGMLVRDESGNLWTGTELGLFRWKPGSSAAYLSPGLKNSEGHDGVATLAPGPGGSLWAGMVWTGRGRGLQQFREGIWKPVIEPGLDSSTLSVLAMLRDRDGGLWVGTANQGIYHIRGSHVDRFRSQDGLTANQVKSFYEDREGGIWAVTARGIESFHRPQIVTFSTREGLSVDNVVSVVVSLDNTVWLANGNSLDSIKDGHVSSVRSGSGLPGNEVTALFADHAGQLWVGVDSDLFLYKHGRFRRVVRSDGSSTRFIVGMTEDMNHDIWAEVSGSNRELIRIRNLKVVEEYPAAVIPTARLLAADRHGAIWLGLRDGNLARFSNGQAKVFTFPHSESDVVRQVVVNPDDSVFATTVYGLIAWRDGKTQTLTSRNGLPCDDAIGVNWDNQGALWLYMECGLVRIDKEEIQKWWNDPEALVVTRVFDSFDGLLPGKADYNPTAQSSDGRLWFANKVVLQMIDPNHLFRNEIPPPVYVEGVAADRKPFSATETVRLPPLVRDLQIDYTALSFVNPRRVMFRYRLEGRDASWQDAGTRRQAFYNDLGPGKYQFHVIACNNDQVWNETGATLAFNIPPAWYQTFWFRILCVIFLLWLTYMLYVVRMRSYAKSMKLRFDERLNERTRLARELHDTLLQTIQGSKLVADGLEEYLDDPPRAKRSLAKLSQWLSQAVDEGRAALESLRNSPPSEELAEALQHTADESAPRSMRVLMTVTGDVRPIHPVARDEVYLIAFEAIRNACVHSNGSTMTIVVSYGRDLKVQIHDNGCGFDPDLIHRGRPGHFGITGMKERASTIGARLSLQTSGKDGTQFSLVIPGRSIFRSSDRNWRWLLSKIIFPITKS
jgi:signal transduction histidine kinase/ligand-binding sensor domain-containing protein